MRYSQKQNPFTSLTYRRDDSQTMNLTTIYPRLSSHKPRSCNFLNHLNQLGLFLKIIYKSEITSYITFNI